MSKGKEFIGYRNELLSHIKTAPELALVLAGLALVAAMQLSRNEINHLVGLDTKQTVPAAVDAAVESEESRP